MGKKKVRTVKNGGDEGLAQMAYDEGACENPWPSPDWDAMTPIICAAMDAVRNGTLDENGVEEVVSKLRPHISEEDPCTLSGMRKDFIEDVRKYRKKRAKQAKRDAAAAPSSQSRPTVPGGDGCCRREDEPSNVA